MLQTNKAIISAPFGNYIHSSFATSTVGTFTADYRRGRIIRSLWTIRYSRCLKSWINKIGLRNPGIDWLVKKDEKSRKRGKGKPVFDKIVSVMGLDSQGRTNYDLWLEVINKASTCEPLAVEINVSCPNIGKKTLPNGVYKALFDCMRGPERCIVKIPPINYDAIIEEALEAGLKTFHCCNTIPTPNGGIGGKALKPVSLHVIRKIRENYGSDIWIIGGGGITCTDDIDEYFEVGADYISIGSTLFNPLSWMRLRFLAQHATLCASLRDIAEKSTQI